MAMKRIQTWIEDLESRGRLFFTKKEALDVLGISHNAFHLQAKRLYLKKRIVRIKADFFVVVPFQFRRQECIPPHWVIDPYFWHIQKDYYVGLLSAASFYGATHQQPMGFHVMVDHIQKPLKLPNNVMIYFHLQRYMDKVQTQETQIPTGGLRFATRSQTMVDLVRFYKLCGYLDNVALVIQELAEDVSPEDLEAVLSCSNTATLQRLGYILEKTRFSQLSECVHHFLSRDASMSRTLLKPEAYQKTGEYHTKWQLIINDPLDVSSYA